MMNKNNRKFVFITALAFATIGFAGCAGQNSPETTFPVQASETKWNFQSFHTCPSELQNGLQCTENEKQIVISGKIQGTPLMPFGAYIATYKDVIIRDFDASGVQYGLHFVPTDDCTCIVTLDNVTLDGIRYAEEAESNQVFWSQGIAVSTAYLRNLDESPLVFKLKDVAISGFDIGAVMGKSETQWQNVSLTKMRAGAYFINLPKVELSEVRADSLEEYAFSFANIETVTIKDSTISNTRDGVQVNDHSAAASIEVERTMFSDNGEALSLGGPTGRIQDSTFEENGVGIKVPSHLSFILSGNIAVHRTNFEGNQMAVKIDHTNFVLDARENWWGHPLGPSLIPDTFGDPTDAALFVPFSSTPYPWPHP